MEGIVFQSAFMTQYIVTNIPLPSDIRVLCLFLQSLYMVS